MPWRGVSRHGDWSEVRPARCSWREKIIVRRYCKDLPAKALCELDRILWIPEAEKNAVSPVDLSETPYAKFFAMLETELDHRIQFATKASFGHIRLDEMRIDYGRRACSSV
jgi:hypothetical protein